MVFLLIILILLTGCSNTGSNSGYWNVTDWIPSSTPHENYLATYNSAEVQVNSEVVGITEQDCREAGHEFEKIKTIVESDLGVDPGEKFWQTFLDKKQIILFSGRYNQVQVHDIQEGKKIIYLQQKSYIRAILHEYVHIIHHYSKWMRCEAIEQPWILESTAEGEEVDHDYEQEPSGRIDYDSLLVLTASNYVTWRSFGAFLDRNFPGCFKRIINNRFIGQSCVEQATNCEWNELIKQWKEGGECSQQRWHKLPEQR